MKFKGRVHCRSSFSVLNEGVELSIKQFLLFFRTPPSLRKKPSKIRSCTPSQQIMELEEACSLIAMDMEELFSQFSMSMKNLTHSLLCTLLVISYLTYDIILVSKTERSTCICLMHTRFIKIKMKFKGRVHCRSSFSVLNEGVELSIKQFLLFFRTPPSLRKKPSKIRSCTPSQQIMELEEACSLIAMDMEELFSQFAMQMKNLTRSLLCTLLVVYSWNGTIWLVVCEAKEENIS